MAQKGPVLSANSGRAGGRLPSLRQQPVDDGQLGVGSGNAIRMVDVRPQPSGYSVKLGMVGKEVYFRNQTF